jgi:TATA-box binding protein (TBP) (component of TFIID and TFIIIB)
MHTVPQDQFWREPVRDTPLWEDVRSREARSFAEMDTRLARALRASIPLFEEAAAKHESPQNVVCVVQLSSGGVELHRVAMRSFNKYRTQRFPSCIIRYSWPGARATQLLFRPGSTVCVGVRSIWEALVACHQLRLELHDEGYVTRFACFQSVNSVHTFSVNHGVDLATLYRDYQGVAAWEPEEFPGLELTLSEYDAVVRVFDTGQCVLMGVRDARRRTEATRHVRGLLAQYRDNAVPRSDERFGYRNERKAAVMRARAATRSFADRSAEGLMPPSPRRQRPAASGSAIVVEGA